MAAGLYLHCHVRAAFVAMAVPHGRGLQPGNGSWAVWVVVVRNICPTRPNYRLCTGQAHTQASWQDTIGGAVWSYMWF